MYCVVDRSGVGYPKYIIINKQYHVKYRIGVYDTTQNIYYTTNPTTLHNNNGYNYNGPNIKGAPGINYNMYNIYK